MIIRRKTNRQTLGEAIDAFIRQFKLNEGMQEARIKSAWEEWMGKTISKYTQEVYLHKRKLYIRVVPGPLKQELFYMKDQIKERVNKECNENVVQEVVVL